MFLFLAYLLAFLVDLYTEKVLKIYEQNGYDDPEPYVVKVFELCDNLGSHYDTCRNKYWKYVSNKFQHDKEVAKFGPNPPTAEDNDEIATESQKLNGIRNGSLSSEIEK